jgi:hypothetical protein
MGKTNAPIKGFSQANQSIVTKFRLRFSTSSCTRTILTLSSGKGPGSRTGFCVSSLGIPAFDDGCGEMILGPSESMIRMPSLGRRTDTSPTQMAQDDRIAIGAGSKA